MLRLPPAEALDLVTAAADEADEAVQVAAVRALGADALDRPDLVVDRYADLLPAARIEVGREQERYVRLATERILAGNHPARHGAYRLVADLGGDAAAGLLIRGLADDSARVRDGVVAALDRHVRTVTDLLEQERRDHHEPGHRCPTGRRDAALQTLAEVLRQCPAESRSAFAALLAGFGEHALPIVHAQVLGSGDVELRQALVRELTEQTSRGGVALLFALARERAPLAQAIARDLLQTRRDTAFAMVVAAHVAAAALRAMSAAQQAVRDTPWLAIVDPVLHCVEPRVAAGLLALIAESGLDPGRLQPCLLEFLRSGDADTRRRAIDLLRERGIRPPDEVVEQALRDPDEWVQLAAAQTVIALDVPQKVTLLTPLLGAATEAVRRVAMGEISKVSFGRYLQRFGAMDPKARQIAARALAKIDASMLDRLADEVASLDATRRLKALQIVELLDAEEQLQGPLLELLEDPDDRVRATAVRIVALTGCMEGMRLLVAALADSDRRVRANAIETFEQLQDRRFVGLLSPFLRDPDNRVRANAAKALWNLGWTDAREELLDMLSDADEAMRISAVWAIGTIGFEDARELLDARESVELSGKVRLKIRETLGRLAAAQGGAG